MSYVEYWNWRINDLATKVLGFIIRWEEYEETLPRLKRALESDEKPTLSSGDLTTYYFFFWYYYWKNLDPRSRSMIMAVPEERFMKEYYTNKRKAMIRDAIGLGSPVS